MDKLLEILKSVGIPFAYDHFAEGESPEPPFICYLLPDSDNFSADGKAYYKINEVHKKFCSDRCRMKWWNSHLDQVQRKANYDFVCPVCKKPFTVYGNANRKYCSHEC